MKRPEVSHDRSRFSLGKQSQQANNLFQLRVSYISERLQMSGRLVILRHKSWNVWNQDNQEKVLRDERLHAEKLKAEQDTEQDHIREKAYDSLVGTSMPKNESKPFRLFEDIEQKEAQIICNPEYEKERKEREEKKRKREGVEDWKFGDGSSEMNGIKVWYEQSDAQNKELSLPKRQKDDKVKLRNDPMAAFLLHQTSNEAKLSSDGDPPSSSYDEDHSKGPLKSTSSFSSATTLQDRQKLPVGKVTLQKSKGKVESSRSKTHDPFEELRKRRLEREKKERKREAVVRAEADIYGSFPVDDYNRRYNQQYHPNISRR